MKEIIQAVYSTEVEEFLSNLGLADRFKDGEIRCHACGDVITTQNFKALTRRGDRLLFACPKDHCLLSLVSSSEAR